MMSRRAQQILLVVVLALFINLPLAHSTWTGWRVQQQGVDVTAQVLDRDDPGGEDCPALGICFRLPEEVDPDRTLRTAILESAAAEEADRSGELQVRVVEGDPEVFRVEGALRSSFGYVVTGVADVILLVIVLLARRGRRSRAMPVRISALHDMERCPPGTAWEELADGTWLARGEVVGLEDDEIMLDVGDRVVVVILDGHANEVGWQQPAQVRGRLIG